MKTNLIILLLLTTSLNVVAEKTSFSIQIAAVKMPKLAFYTELAEFGSLYTEETEIGLVRIKLGAYSNREEAGKDLLKIKNKGFSDAFIAVDTSQKVVTPAPSYSEEKVISTSKDSGQLSVNATRAWTTLTEAQKREVMYVDGMLLLQEGEEVITISNY